MDVPEMVSGLILLITLGLFLRHRFRDGSRSSIATMVIMVGILLSGIGAANVVDGGSRLMNLGLQSVALIGVVVVDHWATEDTTPL